MFSALLGALIGGALALSGAFLLELRRDRRRQNGAARLVAAGAGEEAVRCRRAGVELGARILPLPIGRGLAPAALILEHERGGQIERGRA